jgi:hypothetical protein
VFLVLCLAVFSIAFWVSALAAETFMRSDAERQLGPAARIGFGFVLTLLYFNAAWQVVSITQAWMLALALMSLQAWSAFGFSAGALRAAAAGVWARYGRVFGAFLGGALVFFMPLEVVRNFGPFTEGGGDVSIYADTTKYLVDRELTAFGLPSRDLEDLAHNLHEVRLQGAGERPDMRDSPLLDPPFPEYGSFRILMTRTMSPFLYTPFAMYSFLADETNYHVYYGLQCFVYLALLAAIWSFFRRFGSRMGAIAVAVAALSHSLVSIFYNTYSAQGIAVLISALVLTALPHVRLLSWAALRTYGCALMVTWITYVHYLSVVVPMVCVAVIPGGAALARAAPAASSALSRVIARAPAIVAFVAAFATLAWAGALKSIEIAEILMRVALSPKPPPEILMYMGMPIDPFSFQWIAFMLGFASQQHFLPYMAEYPPYVQLLRVGGVAGLLAAALGAFAMARWATRGDKPWRAYLRDTGIYAMALLTIIVHLILVRTSLYTQAKGAQNVLVLTLVVLLLPLAVAVPQLPAGSRGRWLRTTMEALLVVFVAIMLLLRVQFGYRIALGLDRAAILESSYFEEAQRIRRSDANPLVLFEPRKSADLYTSNQPFYGVRMLPTRELVLQRSVTEIRHYLEQRIAMAVDFIAPDDLPHVWTLRAERTPRWPVLTHVRDKVPQMPYVYRWHAERLVDHKVPTLVLSGDTFERPYGGKRLGDIPQGEIAPFNFMRNGVVSLYLPGSAAHVEVELQPREGELALLEPAIANRVEAGEFGPDVRMSATNRVVRLSYEIAATGKPSLRTIVRHKGEFFVSVKVNGKYLE